MIPINEIIASAVINLPRNHYDSLPKMLHRAIESERELAQIHRLEFVDDEKTPSKEGGSDLDQVLFESEKLQGAEKI